MRSAQALSNTPTRPALGCLMHTGLCCPLPNLRPSGDNSEICVSRVRCEGRAVCAQGGRSSPRGKGVPGEGLEAQESRVGRTLPWPPGSLLLWVRVVLVWRSLSHTRASFNAALGLLNARQREEWRKRELASNDTSFCLLWTHMSPLSQPFSSYRWTSSACLSLPLDCELLECKDAVSYSQLLPPCLAQTLIQGMCLLIVGEMNEQVHGWRKAVLLSMQRWEEGINLWGTFLWAFNIHPPLLHLGRNCCICSRFILHRYLGRVWPTVWNSKEKKADGP